MIRSFPLNRPSAVDLPRPAAPADPSRAAGSGLPPGIVSGLAVRLATASVAAGLPPYPAPKKEA